MSIFGKKNDGKNLFDKNEFTCPVCGKKGKVNDLDTCKCGGSKHVGFAYVHGRCFNRQAKLCDDCYEIVKGGS